MKLVAPMAGWATRLEEVPDPAFAQRMVGDGIAVDPTTPELLAPCDGVVVSVHASRHACTLRTRTGACRDARPLWRGATGNTVQGAFTRNPACYIGNHQRLFV